MSGSNTPAEFLSFPVCGDCGLDFNEDDLKPLLLPCQHVFCRACLNEQEDNDCQNCRTCSESWSGGNVTQLPVVYDLIPPGEGATGREVVPDGRATTSRREMAPALTGREVTPMDTGTEVTPASRGGNSASQQGKSKSSARFPVCTICEEDFNMRSQRPLKLPCGHSFCCSCLEALRNSANSTCPKCRGEWPIVEFDKLPVVKNLVHPSNKEKNVPRAPSTASGYGRVCKSDEELLKRAEALRLRNSTQTRPTTQARPTTAEIYVRDTRNRTNAIRVNLQRDTVESIRPRVAEVTGVPASSQRLLYNSRQLEDGRPLSHYGIKPHETITQTCRLQGGAMMN